MFQGEAIHEAISGKGAFFPFEQGIDLSHCCWCTLETGVSSEAEWNDQIVLESGGLVVEVVVKERSMVVLTIVFVQGKSLQLEHR